NGERISIQPLTSEVISTLRFRRRQWPQRRRSGATVLIVKGAFVYFFSFGPPVVARASAAAAWHGAWSATYACTPSGRLFCRAPRRGAARQTLCSAGWSASPPACP